MRIKKRYAWASGLILLMGIIYGIAMINSQSLGATTYTGGTAFPAPSVTASMITYNNGDNGNPYLNTTYYGPTANVIGRTELLSHASINYVKQVRVGNSMVVWFKFNFPSKITNGLGKVYFYDNTTGASVAKGYAYYQYVNNQWVPYNSLDIPAGNSIIGIMVNVAPNEKVDVVPTIAGQILSKYAIYTSGAVFTNDGPYTVVTYINNGTFNVTNSTSNVSVLVVGGGGGGSGNVTNGGGGAGGGAGGVVYGTGLTIANGNYSVVVGSGGSGGVSANGNNGGNSSFIGFIGVGGGAGGYISSGAGTNVTDSTPYSLNTQDTPTGYSGMKIVANYNEVLKSVGVATSDTGDIIRVFSDCTYATLLASAPISNHVADFGSNFSFTAGNTYCIVETNSGGGSWTRTRGNQAQTYPTAGTNINWTAGASGGGDDTNAFDINNITTSIASTSGFNGGSGGGATIGTNSFSISTQPSYGNATTYGNNGGEYNSGYGGGGGAGSSGGNGSADLGGNGGNGVNININGTSFCYAGGGGGGSGANDNNFGNGTCDGGSSSSHFNGYDATGYGSGGGGSGYATVPSLAGGSGSGGVVIIRYLNQNLSVTLTSPQNRTLFTPLEIPIPFQADVETAGSVISNVTFYIDGSIVNSSSTGSTGTYTFNYVPVSYGNHTWDVRATDQNNINYTSINGTMQFDYEAPVPNQTSTIPNFTMGYNQNLVINYDNYINFTPDNYSNSTIENAIPSAFFTQSLIKNLITPLNPSYQYFLTTSFNAEAGGTNLTINTYNQNQTIRITPVVCNTYGNCLTANQFYIFVSANATASAIATQNGNFFASISDWMNGFLPAPSSLSLLQSIGLTLIIVILIGILGLIGLSYIGVEQPTSGYITGILILFALVLMIGLGYVSYWLLVILVVITLAIMYLRNR